jgi:hypothetical protein
MAKKLGRTLAVVAAPLLAAGGAGPALAVTATPNSPQQPGAPQAPAAVIYDSWQNQWSAKYLHAVGNGANGNLVNVNTDDGSCAHGPNNLGCNEEWQQLSTGFAHEWAYKNVFSGKCLSDDNDLINEAPIQYSCGNLPVQRRWHYGDTSGGGSPIETLEVSALTVKTNGFRVSALLCEDRYGKNEFLKTVPNTSLSIVSYYQAESNFGFLACSWQ